MPKMKTHRGAAKRFRATQSGGFKRNQSHRRHLMTEKSTKRKRHLRHHELIATADQATVRRLLPNS